MIEERLKQTEKYLKEKIKTSPKIGVVLGSGLGEFAEAISSPTKIDYKAIPNFPVSTVAGHAGRLVFGNVEGKNIVAMQGRFHYYEGYTMGELTYGVRVMHRLGAKILIVTNAAGGTNPLFKVGDLMVINDHINFLFANPLRGEKVRADKRFVDMAEPYSKRLRDIAKQVGLDSGFSLQEGVLLTGRGPSYETNAEIRMFRKMGADAVSMSTVPEVLIARFFGMEVLGISCITNLQLTVPNKKTDHDEVMEATKSAQDNFVRLLNGVIAKI